MGDIFDIIRDKANRREDPVPQDAWENIMRQKRRRRPAGFIWLAAALLFIAIGIGVYQMLLKQNNTDHPGYSNNQEQPANDNQSNSSNKSPVAELPVTTGQVSPSNSENILSSSSASSTTSTQDNQRKSINEDNDQGSPAPLVSGYHKEGAGITTSHDRQGQGKTYRQPVSGNISDQALATRKKKNRKDKAASAMSIENAETADSNDNQQNANPLSSQDKPAIAGNPKSQIETTLPVVSTEPIQKTVAANDQLVSDKKNEEKKEEPVLKNTLAKAAEKEKKKGKPKTWSAELALTPMLFVSGYDHDATFRRSFIQSDSKSIFDGKLTRSHINPTVAISAMLRKEINQKLNIGIGIQYLRMKELVRISGKQVNTLVVVGDPHLNPGENPEWVTDTTNLVFEATGDINAINRYTFVNLPISVQYRLWNKKKWSIAMETGLTLHVSSRYDNHINKNPAVPLINTTHQSTGKTNIGFSVNAGLRLGRRINDNLDFFALPFIGINPVKQSIKNTVIDKNIHRAGLQIGMAWKLW